jgi:hypothetical protein
LDWIVGPETAWFLLALTDKMAGDMNICTLRHYSVEILRLNKVHRSLGQGLMPG